MRTETTYCDGLKRRDVLRLGVGGAFGYGLTLSEILAARARGESGAGESTTKAATKDVSLIVLFLKGGLSTIDTFDLKPLAPAEFRGQFRPIDTNVPGIQIGEHLPLVARELDKFSLIRSFGHRNSSHGDADHYMLTGYHPVAGFNPTITPNNQRPAHGAVISRTLGARGSVPPYVCLPQMHPSAGSAYLGAAAAPFAIEANPAAPDFAVPDLAPPVDLPADRLDERRELLARIDRYRRAHETLANRGAAALDVFRQKAIDLMTSGEAKRAFDLAAEPETLRDRYGRTTLGQSCLMARRLVEAGVRCVTIEHTNWDTHDNNFVVLTRDLLPSLDSGMSALFADLAERGMLESTIVLVTGEFGRTPRINGNSGRDHWGPSFTVMLGGGGVQGGRVIGESDARAEKPARDPHGPEDLAATLYHLLGIDAQMEFHTPEGRPMKIASDGRLIRGLI